MMRTLCSAELLTKVLGASNETRADNPTQCLKENPILRELSTLRCNVLSFPPTDSQRFGGGRNFADPRFAWKAGLPPREPFPGGAEEPDEPLTRLPPADLPK